MLHTYAPAIFLVIVFILIRFSTVDTNTMCLRFRSDPLSRAFIKRCVFGESTQRISVDGRPKRIARWCGRGLISVTKTFGRDLFNQNSDRSDRKRWSTSKGGPVFSKLFRLDRNFRKCWSNGSRPFTFWDEYIYHVYEYEIFSILSIACAWTGVILAGKHDCRRHSTMSFSQNVVVTETSYKVLEVLSFCGWEMT